MSDFKKVDSAFSGLKSFVVESKSLIEQPYRDRVEDVFIEAQILERLDDGMEIELCLWTDCDCHMSFWDVSVEKKLFDEKSDKDYLSYLKEKRVFLENIEDKYGNKWCYGGLIECDDVYRIQYNEQDE